MLKFHPLRDTGRDIFVSLPEYRLQLHSWQHQGKTMIIVCTGEYDVIFLIISFIE